MPFFFPKTFLLNWQKAVKLIYLFILFVFCPYSYAELPYNLTLIREAENLKLYEDPQWLALLHYKTNLLGGYESMAEWNSLFFNSPNGKTNPKDELNATIQNFFKIEDREEGEESQPYQCAFKARYTWLKSKLHFDPKKLTEVNCKRYEEWYKSMNPSGLTLVFPSTYINNPASAFGHTLLRIDQPDQTEKTRLLAYTAHYAATTGGENALLYALKGIFGGYPGYFSVAPYYEKVKKYSDLEKRDIWEYSLVFSTSEIELMLMHIWELRLIPFSYYYFDENCSYHLLSLLDVARPSLKLSASSGTWVLPLDTIRSLTAKPGVVSERIFRPSVLTKLNYSLSSMTKEEMIAAKTLSARNGGISSKAYQDLKPESKAKAIEAAYEYLNYRVLTGDSESQKQAYSLLSERSKLPQGDTLEVPSPKFSPDESHGTARVGFGMGRQADKWFYDIRYRGVYHDLMDPKEGYSDGAQIEMLDTVFRHKEAENFRLNKLDFVDIISLSPGNDLIKPKSWYFKSGFDSQIFDDNNEHLYFQSEGGFGYTWVISEKIFAFSLLGASAKFSDNFEEKHSVGIKPKAGLYYDLKDYWRINLNSSYANYFLGDNHNEIEYGLEQRVTLGTNSAIKLEYKYAREFSEYDNRTILSFDFYL